MGNVQMGHMKYHEIGRWNLMSISVVETPLSFFVAASLLRCSPSGPEARRTKKPSDWLIGSSEFQFPLCMEDSLCQYMQQAQAADPFTISLDRHVLLLKFKDLWQKARACLS